MYMSIKKRTGQNAPLFVFHFLDQKDFEGFCANMELYANYAREGMKAQGFDDYEPDMLLDKLERLKSRVDDRYADENYALSGCLFEDEAEIFFNTLFVVQFYSSSYLLGKQNEALDMLISAQNEHLDTLREYNELLEETANPEK